jgi:hypothetical protein
VIAALDSVPDFILDFVGSLKVLKGTCFATDNRDFDTSPDASARIRVEFVIVIDGSEMKIIPYKQRQIKSIGLSHNVDCKTGTELQPSKRALDTAIVIGEVQKSNFMHAVYVAAAAANPFYPKMEVPGTNMTLGMSPDIDFVFVFRYENLQQRIAIDGTIGYFPSFGGYYSMNEGQTITMFQLPPYRTSTALNLVDFSTGINTRNVSYLMPLF